MKVTYVSWDGPDQNYMESLFLPLFERTQTEELHFSVLQFTFGSPDIPLSIGKAAAHHGIFYESVKILRKPLAPATLGMIVYGAQKVVKHVRRVGAQIVIPRSIITAAMVLIARRHLPGIKIIFDTDGLMADERVEFGGWNPSGANYRLFRDIEAEACRVADAVLSRTLAAREILIDRAGPTADPKRFQAIPNGKDTQVFAPLSSVERDKLRIEAGVGSSPWIIYAGSLGPQYHPEAMLDFFEAVLAKQNDAVLTILTGNTELAHALVKKRKLSARSVRIRRMPPGEVPHYLASADLGLALREPSFSQRGVCPIKLAEYLLCGLPVVATAGVGDTDHQIDAGVGYVIEDLDCVNWETVVEHFFETILPNRDAFRERCRARGLEHFDIENVARSFREIILKVV